MNNVSMTISYRYIQPQLTLPIKHSAKKIAQVVTGFNDIHYRVSNGKGLTSLIEAKALPDHQQPRYDTLPNNTSSHKALAVDIFDSDNQLSHFRTLRLQLDSDSDSDAQSSTKKSQPLTAARVSIASVKANTEAACDTTLINESTTSKHKTCKNETCKNDTPTGIAPPPLPIMSLFLLCRSDNAASSDWSIGVVRWLNLDTEKPELEWQVLGHKLIPCGVRLQDRGTRSRHFIPALVVGDDEQLQTAYSLLLPTSHFQTGDRVIMRIDNKQKTLRLVRHLMTTDEFSQYEVVQI